MCLEWLDGCLVPGASVIDYGCGSGILAIAAARLGAGEVTAVDIDPQAVESTIDNAQRNHARVRSAHAEAPIHGQFDVVLANILANPLRMLAPLLTALVAPGGTLVLAGLLTSQAREISACYPMLKLEIFAERDGWACLAGGHRAAA
jgi:ribosomal protein L11 methyltransferase